MKIEVTDAQLMAIKSLADDVSSMLGGVDPNVYLDWKKQVRLIDRMLAKNKLPRRDFN